MNVRARGASLLAIGLLTACSSTGDPLSPGQTAGGGGLTSAGFAGETGSGGAHAGTTSSAGGTSGGGATASGGATMGGASAAGGRGGVGGAANGGESGSGGNGGNGGTPGVASLLDGLRVEDPCGELPAANVTCPHVGTQIDGDPFGANESVTMGGTAGVVYAVKLHVRGATEPTHIMGGSAGSPANFVVGGAPYAPGSNEANYEYWRISVDSPAQVYYLNAFDDAPLAHVIHVLDFRITVPIAAGAHVRLEVRDENGHEISNDASASPDGVAPAPDHGQFVQLNVDSALASP